MVHSFFCHYICFPYLQLQTFGTSIHGGWQMQMMMDVYCASVRFKAIQCLYISEKTMNSI